jgi:hypothetical protein
VFPCRDPSDHVLNVLSGSSWRWFDIIILGTAGISSKAARVRRALEEIVAKMKQAGFSRHQRYEIYGSPFRGSPIGREAGGMEKE